MRCLLLTVGSRGDAEPFVALSSSLVRGGHDVHLFLQPEHSGPYIPEKVTVHDLPFSSQDFYQFVANPSHGKDDPDPRVQFVGVVSDVIGELVLPCHDAVEEVAKRADVLVSSSLGRPLMLSLSRRMSLPLAIVHLQPLAPTRSFPHYSMLDAAVHSIIDGASEDPERNPETYWKYDDCQHEFLRERMAKIDPGAPSKEDLRVVLSGRDEKVHIFNCFAAEELCPATYDGEGKERIYDVGALADDYLPDGYTPPNDLVRFLEECGNTPPVCVGFGSMPGTLVPSADAVKDALQLLDRRAILVGGAISNFASNAWTDKHIFKISTVPYSWLLPRCRVMVSHGGAGVMHATLRAGIPCVIVPVFGDQFFWARLLEARGVGVHYHSIAQKKKDEHGVAAELAGCLEKADACLRSASELGHRLGKKYPNARGNMVGILATIVLKSYKN